MLEKLHNSEGGTSGEGTSKQVARQDQRHYRSVLQVRSRSYVRILWHALHHTATVYRSDRILPTPSVPTITRDHMTESLHRCLPQEKHRLAKLCCLGTLGQKETL